MFVNKLDKVFSTTPLIPSQVKSGTFFEYNLKLYVLIAWSADGMTADVMCFYDGSTDAKFEQLSANDVLAVYRIRPMDVEINYNTH